MTKESFWRGVFHLAFYWACVGAVTLVEHFIFESHLDRFDLAIVGSYLVFRMGDKDWLER